jgi:hypothetical protein
MAFVEIDEILKEQGRRLDSHFAITVPDGNDALVQGQAAQINEERVERLEATMLARFGKISRLLRLSEVLPEKVDPSQVQVVKSYTGQNGRYHHPEITANDIAGQKVRAV